MLRQNGVLQVKVENPRIVLYVYKDLSILDDS